MASTIIFAYLVTMGASDSAFNVDILHLIHACTIKY